MGGLYTLRPLDTWPGKRTNPRQPSRFDASWSDTQQLLARELDALRARPGSIVLQIEGVRERDLRIDGELRANATVPGPGVILSIDSRQHGALTWPCDTFEGCYYGKGVRKVGWQSNVRAIALGLEALRKVDRYGITSSGQQYTGWKQLGAGTPMPAARMSVDEAARLLVQYGEVETAEYPADPADLVCMAEAIGDRDAKECIGGYYRRAAKRHHPDTGGDPDLFRRLTEARDVLEAHRG
jgi:hypothetical protein